MEVKEKAVRGCKVAREAPTMLLTWELCIAGWSTTFWIRSKWFPNRSRNALEINLVSPTDPASSRHLSKKSFMSARTRFMVTRSELVSLLKEQLLGGSLAVVRSYALGCEPLLTGNLAMGLTIRSSHKQELSSVYQFIDVLYSLCIYEALRH